MASIPVMAGQEMDEGLEEMWLGSAQGIHGIDAGEFIYDGFLLLDFYPVVDSLRSDVKGVAK